MKISKIKLTLALMGLLTSASAQERMDLSKAKHYAQITRQNTEQFKHAPLSFEADIEQPVALANDSFGGLLIPRARLSEGSSEDVGTEPVAIGELWLYNLTLERNGWPMREHTLDIIPLNTEEGRVRIPRCVLAVSKPSGKPPLLMVYGKSNTPLCTVNLTEREPFQEMPLDMSADESGNATVHILGKYHARFKVAELYL